MWAILAPLLTRVLADPQGIANFVKLVTSHNPGLTDEQLHAALKAQLVVDAFRIELSDAESKTDR